jgi:hypothetical protein
MTDNQPEEPEGYRVTTDDEMVAIKNYPAVRKALYDLAGLFITGPLKNEAKRPEVRSAVAALAEDANWRDALGKLPIPPIPNVLRRRSRRAAPPRPR